MTEEITEENKGLIVVKKDFHRSSRQRILHTIYLILPIIMAFLGYYSSTPLWELLKKEKAVPEVFKFFCTAALFLITSIIIFIITRKSNPVMKITLKNAPEQAD
ncbi:MAG: hypothetical protein K6D95_02725 [Treponema sp.]|nr:hypothetical protein [Treponema sp.]